jgi:predicted anti-sigma-YlaC factor YlaD
VSDLSEACSEARAYTSIELDEELSELEAARLRAHLTACPSCALWADRAGALALLIREAESEEPAATVRVPSRRVNLRHAGAVAGTAASALAVTLAVLTVTWPSARYVPRSQALGDTSTTSGIPFSSWDVARGHVREIFASSTAPARAVPRHRKYPGPI